MLESQQPETALLLVVGEFGVVLLPVAEVELARELASGEISVALVGPRVRAAGGQRIPGPEESAALTRTVVASADGIRVDQLKTESPAPRAHPPVVVDPLETFVPAPEDESVHEVEPAADDVDPRPELAEEPDGGASDDPPQDPFATAVDNGDARFDALFGTTIAGRRIEDAAVRDVPIESRAADVDVPPMVPPPPPPPTNPEPSAVNLPVDRSPNDPSTGGPRGAASEPPPLPSSEAESDALHDGRTMTPERFAALRAKRVDGVHQTSDEPARPRVTLRVPTGETVTLESAVVFGRRPQPRSIGSGASPRLIVIDNPYVSGTHAEVRFDGARVVVTDYSSNGTLLTGPGIPTHALIPNQPTDLVDRSSLQLTDGLTIDVSIEAT